MLGVVGREEGGGRKGGKRGVRDGDEEKMLWFSFADGVLRAREGRHQLELVDVGRTRGRKGRRNPPKLVFAARVSGQEEFVSGVGRPWRLERRVGLALGARERGRATGQRGVRRGRLGGGQPRRRTGRRGRRRASQPPQPYRSLASQLTLTLHQREGTHRFSLSATAHSPRRG